MDRISQHRTSFHAGSWVILKTLEIRRIQVRTILSALLGGLLFPKEQKNRGKHFARLLKANGKNR